MYSSSSSTVWRFNDRLGVEAVVDNDEDGSDMAVAFKSVSIPARVFRA